MLKNDIFSKINHRGEGDFSVEELFDPQEWASYPVQERRGIGRWTYNRVLRGLWNKDGWIVEILPDTDPQNKNPQRYRKRRRNIQTSSVERVFLNEIPGIEQTVFKDMINILNATGKWLEIVNKPTEKNKNVA